MKVKTGKWNDDSYTRLAKQMGFPARSVFKLKEMQKKYSIIKKTDHVLDIGATPGSWSLFASQVLKNNGKIVGVDIKPLEKRIHFTCAYHFILGNIFEDNVMRSMIKAGPYTVILSDAAPRTTGDRIVDATRSYDLALRILEITEGCLEKGGNLVVKIFQGGDTPEFVTQMKDLFLRVKAFKPSASRKQSTEIYYIGFNYENI